MTPPTERRPVIDATAAPSAGSGVDETSPATSAGDATSAGFGPPAAAGEVGTLGPYRVVKELGKGGMGAVYAAIDTRLDRRLALKVMLPQFAADPPSRERFIREAKAAARVKHDHVVTVYEADVRDGVPYIAMEYLEGYPLDEYLKKKGNPTPAQVLKLAAETAAGLAAAHAKGPVHRDVKPGNLWLEAPAGRVKVLDFGLARPVDTEVELTKSGAIVGTPAYMSPEQARGEKVDHRTDLFSLGAVLYRLVTGRLPFAGPNTMAVLIALGTEEPPPVRSLNPAVPEELAALIHQLLAKSADARPASADEVVKRVRAMGPARSSAPAPAASQVVYVPIQVTAVPEANPFADLEASATELEPAAVPVAVPVGRKPAGRSLWAAAGFAGMVLLALGGVIIVIRNKDGTETKIEVPDGATVTLKDKTGKTLASVGPKKAPQVADNSLDRKAAEWVISRGGEVRVKVGTDEVRGPNANGTISAAGDLPRGRFTLFGAGLDKEATDADLENLRGCPDLGQLWLQGTKVTGTGLVALRSVGDLNLSKSKVTDAGLASLREVKGIVNLGLEMTAIGDAGAAHLKDLTQLRILTLNYTVVGDTGLAHLSAHPSLTQLGLIGTPVTDAGLTRLYTCPALGELDVRSTKVTAKGLADFHAAVPGCRIEYDGGVIEAKAAADPDRAAAGWVLSIGGTVHVNGAEADIKATAGLPAERFVLTWARLNENKQVTDAGLAAFKGCTGLTSLGLNGTAVTDAGLAHFRDCKGLTSLNLLGTAVTDAGLAAFRDLKDLKYLNLGLTKLTDAGLAGFGGCKGLINLRLRDTAVTDAGLAAFKDRNSLTILDLGGTRLTNAGLAAFEGCKRLTSLKVQNTGVTAAGVAQFHAAVPGCRIQHDGGVIEPR